MIRDQRGQALTEHALIASALVLAGAGLGWPYVRHVLHAWERHVGLVFTLLDGPFP